LDISKAFDSVSWPFLLEVLHQLGFGQRWCNLICLILSTSSTRVLVNREPGDGFFHNRGLRQGDPLSPMLFILVMEVLNSLIKYSSGPQLLQLLAVQRSVHRASFYADDAIIFLRPNETDLRVMKQILNIFGIASGLHTNFTKSSAYPIVHRQKYNSLPKIWLAQQRSFLVLISASPSQSENLPRKSFCP